MCMTTSVALAEDEAIAAVFARYKVDGTIVLASLNNHTTMIHNNPRAYQRFPAASTFKILNTLIAVQENVVSSKDALFRWNGHVYPVAEWNRNQTLTSAFGVSCVWCYQQIAQYIKPEKYRAYINATEYGTLKEPFVQTTFWLDGSLQVSASEQVNFLRGVYQHKFLFKPNAYDVLRQIMVVEQTPAMTMRAKTGLATMSQGRVGWYVGYIEGQKGIWFFAMNMLIRSDADIPLRAKLTREVLATKGML